MNYIQIKQRLYDVLAAAGFDPDYGHTITISPVLDIAKVRAVVAEQLGDAEYVEMLDLFDHGRTDNRRQTEWDVRRWYHQQSKG